MIEKYLLDNGKRVTDPNQLVPGETYAIGYGIEGFKGFVMPGRERLTENEFEEKELVDVEVYSFASKCPGDKPIKERIDINFGMITMEHLGVIKPYEGSDMRRSIEDALIGKREPESVSVA